MKLEFNHYSGKGGGWSDKTKVMLNSTQFKFKFKLTSELSLEITNHFDYSPYFRSGNGFVICDEPP